MRKQILSAALAVLIAAGCTAESAPSSSVSTDGEPKVLNSFAVPSGDLFPAVTEREAEELTDEKQADVDRAIRAYIPPEETLRVNNAEHFYYYDQLDDEAKGIYDAMLMVCDDPADEDNIVVYMTDLDPQSVKFMQEWGLALYAMEYDHAELFWLYNEIAADMYVSVPRKQTSPKYTVYFQLSEPYEEYEETAVKFNEAVTDFLKDIDTGRSDAEIARQIHDKLIDTVTYDYTVMNDGLRGDLAHTAYGVFVENSRGDDHYAVCDGYSQAYVYLLQQCGIDAAVILGEAGRTEAEAGGHAWSVVCLDDDWYEVDSTWNDQGNQLILLEEARSRLDQASYDYYKEALTDQEYMDRISHYLYNVTTETITKYTPETGKYDYKTKDSRYYINMIGEAVHIRDSENRDAGYYYDLMLLAPIAEGVKYAGN